MEALNKFGVENALVLSIVILAVLVVFKPTRMLIGHLYKDILFPFLIWCFKMMPRTLSWFFEAHVNVIKNFGPRAFIIKEIGEKGTTEEIKK